MVMTDDSWYVVRNTRGVTGFVGPGSKPVPLTEEEVASMGIMDKQIDLDIEVGESVKVVSGPLEDFPAVIQEISIERQKVKVLVKDRKSTRLNSSHANISYAVFCLKK